MHSGVGHDGPRRVLDRPIETASLGLRQRHRGQRKERYDKSKELSNRH